MNTRLILVVVAVIWGVLAAWFALDANLFQAVVFALASLVSLSLVWWYTTHDESIAS
jgi:hypothetical protein